MSSYSNVQTTTILFHQKNVRNMIEREQKLDLLQYIYDVCKKKILDTTYQKYTKHAPQFSDNGPTLIQLLPDGRPYWLFVTNRFSLTTDDYEIFLIEKFLKPQYPTPKVLVLTDFFRGFPMNTEILLECFMVDLKFSKNDLFYNKSSPVSGEIKDFPLLLLLSDILLMNGISLSDSNPFKRMLDMYDICQNIECTRSDDMIIQIQRLFTRMNSIKMSQFVTKLPYEIKGLLFFFCKKKEAEENGIKSNYELPMIFHDLHKALYRIPNLKNNHKNKKYIEQFKSTKL